MAFALQPLFEESAKMLAFDNPDWRTLGASHEDRNRTNRESRNKRPACGNNCRLDLDIYQVDMKMTLSFHLSRQSSFLVHFSL